MPARAGSKGIPGKNLKPLGGRPLLQWTLEAALRSARLDRVILSSDEGKAIELAGRLGCEAPFVRPPELAGDAVPTAAVAVHALDWVEEQGGGPVGAVVVLHPTSPFRDAADIDGALAEFERSGSATLITAVPVSQHPAESYRLEDGLLTPAVPWPSGATGRQGLPPYLYDTGAIYVATAKHLRANGTLHDDHSAVYVLERSHALEIDDPYDLELARAWAAR